MTTPLDLLAAPALDTRLAALRDLARGTTLPARTGTNTHVHTNHSFSVFRSPCEAVWKAIEAGVEVFGINDHFTVAGHDEFARACAAVGLPATFSIEAIGMDRAAEQAKTLMNDPGNPGRVYLCGKGVTTRDDAQAARTLAALRAAQIDRNRQLIAKLDERFRALTGQPGPTWERVAEQAPQGNTTERHVAKACLRRLQEIGGDAFAAVVGATPTGDDAAQQNLIRGSLLKSGKPCYVPEDPSSFPDVAGARALFLQLGAIPTYPVLGNPITDGEKDVVALCDRLAAWGIHALELIPARNTDDRVAAVIAEARRRGWPVFDGTEHNTPTMDPLLTRWGMDERFRPTLRDGALLVLGHQARVARGEPGYVDRAGRLVAGGYRACLDEGRRVHAASAARAAG
ncbi:MAG TPA: PHP domain-containing protein [Planctomycetota bacterium]|nr:PHP domain-containing protein [Planctomycetota bacterium]